MTVIQPAEAGGYFWLSDNRKSAAVIVNITRHSFMKGHLLAIPNYPHMKWLAAQGTTPMEAFNIWHRKHIEHIQKIGRSN